MNLRSLESCIGQYFFCYNENLCAEFYIVVGEFSGQLILVQVKKIVDNCDGIHNYAHPSCEIHIERDTAKNVPKMVFADLRETSKGIFLESTDGCKFKEWCGDGVADSIAPY